MDVLTVEQVAPVSEVADMLQTPAFLCRQTDFIHAVAQVTTDQFLSPQEMQFVVEKAKQVTESNLCFAYERGYTFGYHQRVVDFRGLVTMRSLRPLFSMQHTRCSSLAGLMGHQVVSVKWCHIWLKQHVLLGLTAYS